MSEALAFGLVGLIVGLIVGMLGTLATVGAKVTGLTVEVRELTRRMNAAEQADGPLHFHRRRGDPEDA